MYLLDTNILIYLIKEDERVISYLKALQQMHFSISIISRLEVLMGAHKELKSFEQLENVLDFFDNIVLDKDVAREASFLSRKIGKKLKFKDLIIAATAKIHNKTLITSDKDFLRLSNYKIKLFKS